jgi:hypothetical protein
MKKHARRQKQKANGQAARHQVRGVWLEIAI